MLVNVCGNLGSGKTTLAKALAAEFSASYLPTRQYDATYIRDIFTDPKRWAFEAQMSFATTKARDLALLGDEIPWPAVLDRSFDEDIDIFAAHFAERGLIDERAFDIYCQYADWLRADLPVADVSIFCRTPADICQDRIRSRPRFYQTLYPPDHIEHLASRYERWWASFTASPKLVVDTAAIDIRDRAVVRRLAEAIQHVAARGTQRGIQLDLFEGSASDTGGLNDVVAPEPPADLDVTELLQDVASTKLPGDRILDGLTVYLAAPYTKKATKKMGSAGVIAAAAGHIDEDHIAPGGYRSTLLRMARELEKRGARVILPHRDVSEWGKRRVPPSTIASECLTYVTQSDLVIAVLSDSFGTHTEVGTALGSGIPVVACLISDEEASFFGSAIASSDLVVETRVESWGSLLSDITSGRFDAAIAETLRRLPARWASSDPPRD